MPTGSLFLFFDSVFTLIRLELEKPLARSSRTAYNQLSIWITLYALFSEFKKKNPHKQNLYFYYQYILDGSSNNGMVILNRFDVFIGTSPLKLTLIDSLSIK